MRTFCCPECSASEERLDGLGRHIVCLECGCGWDVDWSEDDDPSDVERAVDHDRLHAFVEEQAPGLEGSFNIAIEGTELVCSMNGQVIARVPTSEVLPEYQIRTVLG